MASSTTGRTRSPNPPARRHTATWPKPMANITIIIIINTTCRASNSLVNGAATRRAVSVAAIVGCRLGWIGVGLGLDWGWIGVGLGLGLWGWVFGVGSLGLGLWGWIGVGLGLGLWVGVFGRSIVRLATIALLLGHQARAPFVADRRLRKGSRVAAPCRNRATRRDPSCNPSSPRASF